MKDNAVVMHDSNSKNTWVTLGLELQVQKVQKIIASRALPLYYAFADRKVRKDALYSNEGKRGGP